MNEEGFGVTDDSPPVNTKKAIAKSLVAALVLCFVFFGVELVAGWLCGSLAILSDAFHLLSDVAGFAISLFALHMGQKGATKDFPFGFKRLEVIGAIVSTLSIWIITIFLVIEAVNRVLSPTPIDAPIMFWTALFGVGVNIALASTLHSGSTAGGCSHGGGGGTLSRPQLTIPNPEVTAKDEEEGLLTEMQQLIREGAAAAVAGPGNNNGCSHEHSHDNHSHSTHSRGRNSHRHEHKPVGYEIMALVPYMEDMDINVRAAAVHVISDLISSIGVLIASIILLVKPDWVIVDPICTFFFSILVFGSTGGLMKRCFDILMEGTPKSINTTAIEQSLVSLPFVENVKRLTVWSVSQDSHVAIVELAISAACVDEVGVHSSTVEGATRVLTEEFGVGQVCVQLSFGA
ncbi:cation efflux protein [Obelidium mucronatum]|nr:cation efflux protein [Obelidium mucronatum]